VSSTSLIYRSAAGYELLMRLLYGRHYGARLQAVADEIPPGATVLELCCGPGTLYFRHLRGRVGSYTGLDVNEGFVSALRRRGVDAHVTDLAKSTGALPTADVVLMQASLYHFLPDAHTLVDRMVAAARDKVVISEPIRNLASSEKPLVGLVGRRAADPGVGGHADRFTEQTLDALMARYDVSAAFLIPGGREKVYVLRGALGAPAPRPDRRSGTAAGP
jgi:SAM-dependent methyltransferase